MSNDIKNQRVDQLHKLGFAYDEDYNEYVYDHIQIPMMDIELMPETNWQCKLSDIENEINN
jgi:hypothetical protein